MAWFEFNGRKSSEMGVIIEKMPSIIMPSRTYDEIQIPGADTNVSKPGQLEKILYSFECRLMTTDPKELRKIISWLSTTEQSKLILSTEEDVYYNAKVINSIPFEKVFRRYTRFIIQFECEPYAYSKEDEVMTLTNKINILFNPGVYENRPIFKIYGSGTCILKVNDNEIKFNNIDGYITMDCSLFECYKEDELMNSKMNGVYPSLKLGDNKIELVQNITKIEITPNWRF